MRDLAIEDIVEVCQSLGMKRAYYKEMDPAKLDRKISQLEKKYAVNPPSPAELSRLESMKAVRRVLGEGGLEEAVGREELDRFRNELIQQYTILKCSEANAGRPDAELLDQLDDRFFNIFSPEEIRKSVGAAGGNAGAGKDTLFPEEFLRLIQDRLLGRQNYQNYLLLQQKIRVPGFYWEGNNFQTLKREIARVAKDNVMQRSNGTPNAVEDVTSALDRELLPYLESGKMRDAGMRRAGLAVLQYPLLIEKLLAGRSVTSSLNLSDPKMRTFVLDPLREELRLSAAVFDRVMEMIAQPLNIILPRAKEAEPERESHSRKKETRSEQPERTEKSRSERQNRQEERRQEWKRRRQERREERASRGWLYNLLYFFSKVVIAFVLFVAIFVWVADFVDRQTSYQSLVKDVSGEVLAEAVHTVDGEEYEFPYSADYIQDIVTGESEGSAAKTRVTPVTYRLDDGHVCIEVEENLCVDSDGVYAEYVSWNILSIDAEGLAAIPHAVDNIWYEAQAGFEEDTSEIELGESEIGEKKSVTSVTYRQTTEDFNVVVQEELILDASGFRAERVNTQIEGINIIGSWISSFNRTGEVYGNYWDVTSYNEETGACDVVELYRHSDGHIGGSRYGELDKDTGVFEVDSVVFTYNPAYRTFTYEKNREGWYLERQELIE